MLFKKIILSQYLWHTLTLVCMLRNPWLTAILREYLLWPFSLAFFCLLFEFSLEENSSESESDSTKKNK